MSYYQGKKKFDREQLVFIVDAILIGVLDRIDSGMPDSISWEERVEYSDNPKKPLALGHYVHGALESAGMAMAVICAQLTGEGCGIGDALGLANDFDQKCQNYVIKGWAKKGKPIHDKIKDHVGKPIHDLYGNDYPDTRKCAEAFVDEVFKAYFAQNKPFIKMSV